MIKLIINADDYGMNPNCTKAITECLCNGSITNTTLMVNMPSCEDAVEQARKNNLLDHIGLHLNFSEGRPLTERMQNCREFCDEHGCYTRLFRAGLKRCWTPLSAELRSIVAEETEAQIKRYLDLGLPVLHFDAHHHSHLVARVIRPVFEVAKRYGFRSVRHPVNLAVRTKLKSKIFYSLEGLVKATMMHPYGFATTQYMGAFNEFRALYDTLHDGDTIELMVHPMYLKNGELDLTGEMSDSGLRPMTETLSFIAGKANEIAKVSFKDIQEIRA